MVKRSADSEDEEVLETLTGSATKRPRSAKSNTVTQVSAYVEEEEEDQLATPAPRGASDAGQDVGNKRVNGLDQELEDEYAGSDHDSVMDEIDDSNVSQGAEAFKRNKQKGVVAEAGVVDTITLKNFMCHRFLEVKLNPQINFIIGHNGSGKSVILTGLVVAFGIKAAATVGQATIQGVQGDLSGLLMTMYRCEQMRAKTAADLVRRGSPSAEVTVSLRNKGEDAYKPESYGKTIYIIRKILAEGGSSYKIQDANKKTISTKREEIALICDHFMIQMDNPVNILNQEMAKTFLYTSNPQRKYQLFLRGTQLAQLTNEYSALLEQVMAIKQILLSKKDRLKDLKENMRIAQGQWREIEQAKNVEVEIRKMKNELAWIQVQDIEKEVNEAVNKQMEEQRLVRKIDEEIKKAQEALHKIEKRIKDAEEAQQEQDADDLEAELTEVRRKMSESSKRIREFKNEQRSMLENVSRLTGTLRHYDEQIEGARKFMDGSSREKQQRAKTALSEVDADIDKYTTKVAEARTTAAELDHEIDQVRNTFEGAKSEIGPARQSVEHAEAMIRGINSRKSNALNAFGQHASQIMQLIDKESGWREKPVGPVGRFVKLKEAQFATLCECLFGETLNAFIVRNQADRIRLNNLVKGIRGARPTITLVPHDSRFEGEFRGARPESRYTTLYDILTIDDPAVLKLLVDTAKIERSIIVRERDEGDTIMRFNKEKDSNIVTCYSADCYRLGGIDGGARMTALNTWRGPPRLSKDVEADLSNAQNAARDAERHLNQVMQNKDVLDRKLGELSSAKRRREAEAQQAANHLRKLNTKKEELIEDTREEEPPDIRALEEAKAEAQTEIENINAQHRAADQQVQELSITVVPLLRRRDDIANLQDQRNAIKANQQEIMETCVTDRLKADHVVGERKKQRQKQDRKTEEATAIVDQLTQRFTEAMEQASEICPREEVDISKSKTRKKYEQQIKSLEKALREKELSVGGSSEEIHKQLVKARNEFEDSKQLIDDLSACAKDVRKAYELRIDRWTSFRHHIAIRSRMAFLYNLTMRGYTGDLKFKHDEQKLELRVKTTETAGKSQRSKDISTLSGGEKSFATICLLLSLWQAAGCPVRGLDEFDVFMDAANRRIAMRMLVDSGRSSNRTQTLLLSPNNIQGYLNTPGVKILKIADPERNQGVLATNTMG